MNFLAQLSTAGFANVCFDPSENDFEFIVGDDRFACSHVVASFLSPEIAKLCLVDPTTASYLISTVDANRCFESILSLCSGSELIVNSSNKPFLLSVSRELGNFELYWEIEKSSETVELPIDNVMSRYLSKQSLCGDIDEEASFIASIFSDIPNGLLRELSASDIDRILSESSLSLKSENWLFDFLIERDLHVLEHVRFEFISTARLVKVIE
jgi:hypothetical protein